ncbi:ketosamine-3-kinase-like [Hetaerina americana]|uniref:ketosamine-3-kinase-like n=1 Tax=Hetaerina americana TaxID=62018 RepID=UPI003A7F5EF8
MEKFLKAELGLEKCESTHKYAGGGGCISETKTFNTDKYGKIFVKFHQGSEARLMFDGEYASLKALDDTGKVSVPKPISVVDTPGGGSAIVMQYIEGKSLHKFQERLGEDLARLHLWTPDPNQCDGKFGFNVDTCCGYIPMNNTWNDDWVNFYVQQRLGQQIRLVEEKTGDREAVELWSQLQLKIPKFFEGVEVKPSLLHGDLWRGNVADTNAGPVIFDPASFWGHHEYDLAIGKMFGGFTSKFHDAYHKIIPKTPGFELRQKLYVLFHQLNHWNHFGSGYRQSSLSIMRTLLAT